MGCAIRITDSGVAVRAAMNREILVLVTRGGEGGGGVFWNLGWIKEI